MAEVQKSVLVGYPAGKMFELVDRIEDYPKFLPWCGGTSVEHKDEHRSHATIRIDYHHVKTSFTTENTRQAPGLIEMTLVDGPFRHLDGHWKFVPLSTDACKIEFRLHYEFSHKVLEKLVAPVFHVIANNFVDAFVRRAEQVLK